MTIIDQGTWILVADGQKALFVENRGDRFTPNFQIRSVEEQPNPPDREQGSDRPGRMGDPGPHRSAVEETDWHLLEKTRFAKDLADILYHKVHAGQIKKLVMVAPPMVLGELRKGLHKEVTERVVGEVPKTLTNQPIYKIEELLA